MRSTQTAVMTAFSQRASSLFVLAGVLWLLDTSLLGLELLTGVSILGTPGPLNPMLYVSGTVVACAGLLGFTPTVADESRWLARTGGAVVALFGTALAVLLTWFVAATVLGQPAPPVALLLLSVLGVALGVVVFGVAGVVTDVPSRTIGALLLTAVAVVVGVLVLASVTAGGEPPAWGSPAIGVGVSASLLAIGVSLRAESPPGGTGESAPDSVPR